MFIQKIKEDLVFYLFTGTVILGLAAVVIYLVISYFF